VAISSGYPCPRQESNLDLPDAADLGADHGGFGHWCPNPIDRPTAPRHVREGWEDRPRTMRSVAKQHTNGSLERLSPERLAELRRPAKHETLEEKRAAIKRATEGFRVNVRVTRDMYRPR
jgi:hypothetical protein